MENMITVACIMGIALTLSLTDQQSLYNVCESTS